MFIEVTGRECCQKILVNVSQVRAITNEDDVCALILLAVPIIQIAELYEDIKATLASCGALCFDGYHDVENPEGSAA